MRQSIERIIITFRFGKPFQTDVIRVGARNFVRAFQKMEIVLRQNNRYAIEPWRLLMIVHVLVVSQQLIYAFRVQRDEKAIPKVPAIRTLHFEMFGSYGTPRKFKL